MGSVLNIVIFSNCEFCSKISVFSAFRPAKSLFYALLPILFPDAHNCNFVIIKPEFRKYPRFWHHYQFHGTVAGTGCPSDKVISSQNGTTYKLKQM